MNDFLFYLQLGFSHVMDIQAYDHVLFLIALVVSYSFKQWKNLLWLVSLFTLGHSVSLALSAYKVVSVNSELVEFLIPLTIFLTAAKNILSGVKSNSNFKILLFFSFGFGWIHGLGFSTYFKMLIAGSETKLIELIEFSLGIEAAQVVIVAAVLLPYFLLSTLFKISKRDWILVLSSIVIGVTIPMLIERYEPFVRHIF